MPNENKQLQQIRLIELLVEAKTNMQYYILQISKLVCQIKKVMHLNLKRTVTRQSLKTICIQ